MRNLKLYFNNTDLKLFLGTFFTLYLYLMRFFVLFCASRAYSKKGKTILQKLELNTVNYLRVKKRRLENCCLKFFFFFFMNQWCVRFEKFPLRKNAPPQTSLLYQTRKVHYTFLLLSSRSSRFYFCPLYWFLSILVSFFPSFIGLSHLFSHFLYWSSLYFVLSFVSGFTLMWQSHPEFMPSLSVLSSLLINLILWICFKYTWEIFGFKQHLPSAFLSPPKNRQSFLTLK